MESCPPGLCQSHCRSARGRQRVGTVAANWISVVTAPPDPTVTLLMWVWGSPRALLLSLLLWVSLADSVCVLSCALLDQAPQCPPKPFPYENLFYWTGVRDWERINSGGFIQDSIVLALIPVTRQRWMPACFSKLTCQLEHLWREYSNCSTVTQIQAACPETGKDPSLHQISFSSCHQQRLLVCSLISYQSVSPVLSLDA